MKNKLLLLVLAAATIIFSGCASGPSFSEYKASIPPLAAGQSRIYFYRTTMLGAALTPAVKVNGAEVGTSKAKGFFFYDAAPGEYVVETSTEVTRKLSLLMAADQQRYVKLNVSMGFMVGHVYPELVENDTGAKEIQECKYTGK